MEGLLFVKCLAVIYHDVMCSMQIHLGIKFYVRPPTHLEAKTIRDRGSLIIKILNMPPHVADFPPYVGQTCANILIIR